MLVSQIAVDGYLLQVVFIAILVRSNGNIAERPARSLNFHTPDRGRRCIVRLRIARSAVQPLVPLRQLHDERRLHRKLREQE